MNSSFNISPWDDEADGVFFALTATLFAASYTYGASVLLASYDDEVSEASSSAQAGEADAPVTVTTEVVVSWTRRAKS